MLDSELDPLPPFTISEMYPWIRDAAAAAAAAAVGFAGNPHHHHNAHHIHHPHHQIHHSGMGQNQPGVPNINGSIKSENGFSQTNNTVNDCMMALDFANSKVSNIVGYLSQLLLFRVALHLQVVKTVTYMH